MEERVAECFQDKIMSAQEAAGFIQSGMSVGVSGFSKVGYPKAIPKALANIANTGHLNLFAGASVGDEIDGDLTRKGLIDRRFGYQSNGDMRRSINEGSIAYIDEHASHFPMDIRYGRKIDMAVIECAEICREGIVLGASAGCTEALMRSSSEVILEVNRSIPAELRGFHDFFDIGIPPNARMPDIATPKSRIGTPYISCPKDKIVAVVLTDKPDEPAKYKPVDDTYRRIGANVMAFLKSEIDNGRLPENIGPIQSGVGNVGNAVLYSLASGGFKGLEMYTEVAQDAALELLDRGVFSFISSCSLVLSEQCRRRFFNGLTDYREKVIIRPQEISNNPAVIRRLGVVAINTPIEADIYGNINSTHIAGKQIMNGVGGSGDFTRNARLNIYATSSVAKGGKVSCIVPMVSHVDQTEHDVHVIITEQGVADLRWRSPRERAELIIENCASPVFKPMLREYYDQALCGGGHTPHDLTKALSWHQRYLETGSML